MRSENAWIAYVLLFVATLQFKGASGNSCALTLPNTKNCYTNITLSCSLTSFDVTAGRMWKFNGAVIISNGGSVDRAKYVESVTNAATTNIIEMTVKNVEKTDEGEYKCSYNFCDAAATLTYRCFPSDATVQLASNKVQIVMDGIAPSGSPLQVQIDGVTTAGTVVYGFTATNGLYYDEWTSTEDAVQGTAQTYVVSVDVGAGFETSVTKDLTLSGLEKRP